MDSMSLTPKQQEIFDQCVAAIDAGDNIYLVGDRRGIVRRALAAHYKWPEPEELELERLPYHSHGHLDFEIEDETLPPGYRHWSQEAKDNYNKQRAEMMKEFMRPITERMPKIGYPFVATSNMESGSDRFRDLFLEAEPPTKV